MCRMLVNDEQLILIFHHPVGVEELSDDLMALLGIFSQKTFGDCCKFLLLVSDC